MPTAAYNAEVSPFPPPSPALTWNAAHLPTVTVVFATGVIIAMSCLAICGLAITLSFGATAPPTPIPPPAPVVAAVQPLEWLAARQLPDGGWPADGGDTRVAVSARATLCFLGQGFDHKRPSPHRAVVERAYAWLTKESPGPSTEAAAWRVMALAEGSALTDDAGLRRSVATGVADLLERRTGPAWPDPAAPTLIDTRTTTIAVMALSSVKATDTDTEDGLVLAKAWLTETAWRRPAGPFPARTRLDGTAEGGRSAESEALVLAYFLMGRRGGYAEALETRVAEGPPPVDPSVAYLRVLGLFPKSSGPAQESAIKALIATEVAAGAVARMTYATLIHMMNSRVPQSAAPKNQTPNPTSTPATTPTPSETSQTNF